MKSNQSRSTQFVDKFLRFNSLLSRTSLCVWIAAFFLAASCTNIGSLGGRAPSSLVNIGDPSYGANGGAYKLVTVLPSQNAAGTSFDMIGENSQFDSYCSASALACKCEFTYTLPGGATEVQTSVQSYQESDLIRCPNAVQSGINNFTVRVVTNDASEIGSNSISVNLASGAFAASDSFLDLSNAQSFVPVNRFQCRRRTFIANPLDSTIIDPIQSEDPKIVYPFNFYTTNASEGVLKMQQSSNQSWDCSLIANQDRTLHWWANPYVYSSSSCSTSFCAGDAELMYPTAALNSGKVPVLNPAATGKRRASFSVAPRPYGVFQIPIKAAVAPLRFVTSTYSTIGYGAKPIPNSLGSSSCPNITLPPKSTWVKLWNYRATDITPPQYVTGSNAMSIAAVSCNPRTSSGVFPSCDVKTVSGGPTTFGNGLDAVGTAPAAGSLAARTVALVSSAGNTNACYKVGPDSLGPTNWTTPAGYANGIETWLPSMYGFENALAASSAQGLPWNLYSSVVDPVCMGGDSVYRFSTAGL